LVATERSSIAAIISKSPSAASSQKSLVTALQDRYPETIARLLAQVVYRLDLVSASKRATDDSCSLGERVTLLTILGRHIEALPLLYQMQKQESGRTKLITTNNIAYTQALLPESNIREALKTATEVLEKASDPELEAMVRDTIALIQMKLGQLEQAKKNIKKVVYINSNEGIDHPVVHLHCFQIYSRCGESKLANMHLRRACKLVGGPQRLQAHAFPSNIIVSEDEVVEIIDEWITGLGYFARIYDLLNTELRPAFSTHPPENEKEVSDRIETILRSAGLSIKREQGRFRYSSKEYVPDFVLEDTSTVVEVKYSGTKESPKRLIAEINDDKSAYLTVYPKILFVIYDRGFINDVQQFVQGIEEVGVNVLIVKH